MSEQRPALPSALERLDDIAQRMRNKRPCLFLDYDGTLTPIVARPELAVLSEALRDTLRRLARHATVAVVSGRDLKDVRERVGLSELYYAGSHGFDIAGPAGRRMEYQQGTEFLPVLEKAQDMLERKLAGIDGCLVERKRFSIAVHFRQVADFELERVERAVWETAACFPGLRRTKGKKIYELQPDIDWDKGKAVHWLLDALGLDLDATLPFYLGDDVTDEDAFAALDDRGVCILVSEEPARSNARYALRDPEEVRMFLEGLNERLEEHGE